MASSPLWLDRVGDTSTTIGSGTYTLSGTPLTSYQAFSVVGNGKSCYYLAIAVDANGNPQGSWEAGRGTYTTSGLTLSRDSILSSSNSGSLVPWIAGTKQIFLVLPAIRIEPALTIKTAATYTVTPEDGILLLDCTSNTITVTLPAAANRGPNPLKLKKIDSTTNTVTINRAGSDLIDGATSYSLLTQYSSITLHSDGTANFYVF